MSSKFQVGMKKVIIREKILFYYYSELYRKNLTNITMPKMLKKLRAKNCIR